VVDPNNLPGIMCQNNLCTGILSGSMKYATSTIVDMKSPFPGTSTLEFMVLRDVSSASASTTWNFECGPTTSSTTQVILTPLMAVGTISTSTNFGTIASGQATTTSGQYGSMTAASGSGMGVLVSGSGNTDSLGRVICKATAEAVHTDYTFATSTTNSSVKINWVARFLYRQ